MKKLFLFHLLFFYFNSSSGQESLSFVKIIGVNESDQTSIFIAVNEWFARTYNSANDVVQMIDKDAGVIIGKGSIRYRYPKLRYSCYEGNIGYTIKVEVKDSRYRIELSDFYHRGTTCHFGLITTDDESSSSIPAWSSKREYDKNTWYDIKQKLDIFSTNIFNSLETATNSLLSKEEW